MPIATAKAKDKAAVLAVINAENAGAIPGPSNPNAQNFTPRTFSDNNFSFSPPADLDLGTLSRRHNVRELRVRLRFKDKDARGKDMYDVSFTADYPNGETGTWNVGTITED